VRGSDGGCGWVRRIMGGGGKLRGNEGGCEAVRGRMRGRVRASEGQ
jgi:hypothetical protein